MAAENFDIVLRVIGGRVAEAELAGVSAETAKVGEAQVAASEKSRVATSGFAKQAVVLGGLYAGYRLLRSSVSTTVELAKASLAFSRATGLDYKQSQAWVVISRERGIQTKQLQVGMATLGRQLGGLTPASKSSTEALKTLGLSQEALLHMPMTQRLDAIANAFRRLPDGPTKAAAAQRLFGRAGQQLIPILNGGSKALQEQLGAAQRLVPATARSQQAALRLAAQQRELNTAMTGVKVAIGTALIPILTALATAIMPVAMAFNHLMQTSKLFRDAIYVVTAGVTGFMVATKLLIPTLYALGVSEEAALGPIGLIVAAVMALSAAFYIAYHHVTWFRNAVNAVVGFLKENWRTAVTVAASVLLGPFVGAIVLVVTHLNWFKNAANNVVNGVKSVFNGLVNFFGSLPGKIAADASHMFTGIFNAAWSVVQRIGSMFSNLAGTITSSLKGAVGSVPLVGGALKGLLAEGGPVTTTGSYLVGERGPEIVTLTRGQTVIPNHDLGTVGGGGDTIIHTHVSLDRREIALAVGRYTSDQQKRR